MLAKRSLFVLMIGMILLMQSGDCMASPIADQQAMKCCGSMPCTPNNQSHGCCKNMLSGQTPNIIPAAHFYLNAPTVVLVQPVAPAEPAGLSSSLLVQVEAQQHSPPELYTLHASLLI